MKKDFAHLQRFRNEKEIPETERYGSFTLPIGHATIACVIAADGGLPEAKGWEHVSVHIRQLRGERPPIMRCPTWQEMDTIKRLFWDDDEVVFQLHISDARKVNRHQFVLHLWKSPDHLNIPPQELV